MLIAGINLLLGAPRLEMKIFEQCNRFRPSVMNANLMEVECLGEIESCCNVFLILVKGYFVYLQVIAKCAEKVTVLCDRDFDTG